MAEDTPPYIPPGAEDEEGSDVLGKLDDLLNRHKPRPPVPGAEVVPLLTDALPEVADDAIPTLTDIVSRPESPPREAVLPSSLEGALVQRLGMRLEVERARLLGEAGGSIERVEVLDELVRRLRESLPDIVQVALDREDRKSAPKSGDPAPGQGNR